MTNLYRDFLCNSEPYLLLFLGLHGIGMLVDFLWARDYLLLLRDEGAGTRPQISRPTSPSPWNTFATIDPAFG